MESLKQSVRPKHQMLILKCYPRLPKNSSADEIKPKGSELSYLLYYASSRRSKLTKVGTFLEKKTQHDLAKGRTATVQITLQILNAFLNNPAISGTGAQGFGLFAPYVLRILRDVLRDASEAALVEAAVPTWDSFCKRQDHIALNAESEFRYLFEEVVKQWASYATKDQIPGQTANRRVRMKVGIADNVKLRMSGLKALKSTADSETLASEAGRQLDTVIPVILQNLYDGDGDLDQIVQLSARMEAEEKEKGKPRPSTSTVEGEQHETGDTRAANRSVAEADKIIDQEAGILALRCLKSIFGFENRTQVRIASSRLLRFILEHRPNPIKAHSPQDTRQDDEWAIRLFYIVCTWVPVQDRFVALFSAVDLFVADSHNQQDLYRQLLLAKIVSHLLAADINLIGISVIDFLLTFLRLMANIASEDSSHAPTTGAGDKNVNIIPPTPMTATIAANGERKLPTRARLLQELQTCASNLAVHVYYTDQISDLIIAILPRIRPDASNRLSHMVASPRPASSSVAGSQATNEDGSPPISERGASNGHGSDGHSSSAGFYFNSAAKREIALNAVYSILLRANESREDGSDSLSTNRNPVPTTAWEGSQWILKDPSENVRGAYVNAFSAWLELELPKLTLEKTLQDEKRSELDTKRKSLNSDLARRAATSSSARKTAGKRSQTAVLQSIHLMAVDLLSAAQDTDTLAPSENGTSPHADLHALAAKLASISRRLELMDLDEFRTTQIPALPLYTSSPKPAAGTLHPDSDADSPSRQPSSSSASFVRPPNPRTRSHSTARRSPSLPGSTARPHGSARQDFATYNGRLAQPGAQVEELKRLLSPTSHSSLAGAGNAMVAKRAVSVGRGAPASTHDNDTASESVWEGSWAGGSSFAMGAAEDREDGGVDVRALLDSLPASAPEQRIAAGPPV